MQVSGQNFEYRINQNGIDYFNQIKDYYCRLVLKMLFSYATELLKNSCGENDGWFTVEEAEKISVNAGSLLERLTNIYHDFDRRPCKIPPPKEIK